LSSSPRLRELFRDLSTERPLELLDTEVLLIPLQLQHTRRLDDKPQKAVELINVSGGLPASDRRLSSRKSRVPYRIVNGFSSRNEDAPVTGSNNRQSNAYAPRGSAGVTANS
jgi:hypothetical protein